MQRRELLGNLIASAAAVTGLNKGIEATAIDKEKPPDLIFLSVAYPMNEEEWLRLKSEIRSTLDRHGFNRTEVAVLQLARVTVASDSFAVL